MSSSTYKLIYFDKRGLGELPRLLFTVAGQPFDDVRLKYHVNAIDKEEWALKKKEMPYGQVPVIEVDGQQIAQSGAIIRFLSRRFNLAGCADVEAALIDAFYESSRDLVRSAQSSFSDKEKLALFWSTGLPDGLAQLEKNIAGALWVGASNTLSYADLALYCTLFIFDSQNREAVQKALDGSPKVKAIWEAVPKIERIAAYLEKRPVTAW